MQHTICVSQGSIALRPVQRQDIEALRIWRNDAGNAQYIRKLAYITPQMQQSWFESYLAQEDHVMFAALRCGELIGSVSLYDIDADTAWFGKLLIGNPSARGKGCAFAVTSLCLRAGFDMLGLERVYASVHTRNLPAIKTYVRAGFLIDGVEPFLQGSCAQAYRIQLDKARFRRLDGGVQEG